VCKQNAAGIFWPIVAKKMKELAEEPLPVTPGNLKNYPPLKRRLVHTTAEKAEKSGGGLTNNPSN
jgi:hypothetical protein